MSEGDTSAPNERTLQVYGIRFLICMSMTKFVYITEITTIERRIMLILELRRVRYLPLKVALEVANMVSLSAVSTTVDMQLYLAADILFVCSDVVSSFQWHVIDVLEDCLARVMAQVVPSTGPGPTSRSQSVHRGAPFWVSHHHFWRVWTAVCRTAVGQV